MYNFENIKESLLRKKVLFEDADFPASTASLGDVNVKGSIVWKRPKEILPDAEFIVNKTTRFDLIQGELSDCWFISAAACLAAEDPSLLERCVPIDQSLNKDYAGIFRFYFWSFGSWVSVYIDDRLPTVDGKLIFAHNVEEPNEFWVPLFEKAYAKLKGKYSDLNGGQTTYALVDFTGGITERIDLKEKRLFTGKLFETMVSLSSKSSLMGCEIVAKKGQREAKLPSGLFTGHAYSITSIMTVTGKYGGRPVKLVRVRNPWGEGEWNGDWSDNSSKWDTLSEQSMRDLELLRKDNGEFWMSFDDWMSHFEYLTICHLDPSSVTAELEQKHKHKSAWETTSYHAEWIKGYNAGGSSMYSFKREKFFSNPQFKVKVKQLSDKDERQVYHLIVSLMQLSLSWDEQNTISFDVYQVREGVPDPDGRNYSANELTFAKKGPTPINLREITEHYELPAGEYVITPFTFQSDINAEFYLRIFMESHPDEVDYPTNVLSERIPPSIVKEEIQSVATKHFNINGPNRKDIDAQELLEVLDRVFKTEKIPNGFTSLETARCLVMMFGNSQHGVLNFEEFCNLLKEIGLWIDKFRTFDGDESNTIDYEELNHVYISIGIHLNHDVLDALISKYGGRKKKISPDEFILCSCKIKNIYGCFKKLSGEKKLMMNLDEWMSLAITF